MEDIKYNVKLTKKEIKMVRNALLMESMRRDSINNSKARDYEDFANYFDEILLKLN